MEWFYVTGGGPLDNSKMHQFSGFSEEVVQVPDPHARRPWDYGAGDPTATTHGHKNHVYVRQHRSDWAPGMYAGQSATYCYRYKGVMT